MKYILVIAIFFTQTLLASWDKYEGERLVLLSLAPGIGDQFPENCEEQMLPSYFQDIASNYPDSKAKIIAIDPRLSHDPASPEYAFLKDWEHDGVTFRKDNIEIECFSEYIPENANEEYTRRVENYLSRILENGGVVFIGHHGQAYYAFEPFRIAYNNLNCDNVQMYICCGDSPPFSTPKVYGNNPCSNVELDEFYEIILPHFRKFLSLYTEGNREACHQLLNSIIQNVDTSFIFYRDMVDLPYKVIRTSDGSLRMMIAEAAMAA
jgi:hypothetical protein